LGFDFRLSPIFPKRKNLGGRGGLLKNLIPK
jgi:hypothetical protein